MRMHRPMERSRTDNTIALINVVFLMLIFFLFAGSVEPNDAHDINPPDVTVEREKTDTGGALVVLPDGSMTLGGAPVEMEGLAAALMPGAAQESVPGEESGAAEKSATSEPLRIVADKSLPASTLNRILADARAAGRERIVLVARQAPVVPGEGGDNAEAIGAGAGVEDASDPLTSSPEEDASGEPAALEAAQ